MTATLPLWVTHVNILDMNYQTLPLPNPEDWITVYGAAPILRTSVRTVVRMVQDGRLTGYRIAGAPDRPASRILWRPQVVELAEAMRRVSSDRARARRETQQR
jgi:excisionase family DNA binding protein